MTATQFQFVGLDAAPFMPLFDRSDIELAQMGARRMTVSTQPGTPCRVSLEDASVGEEVLLLPYEHHAVTSPYQASGPIFVRKNAVTALPGIDDIPLMFHHRLLSLRGYDQDGMMLAATVAEGIDLRENILQMFENQNIEYIHIHNARPGCFNCTVIRV